VSLVENSIFSFYPNPVSNSLTLELVHQLTETLRIYDISGSVVYEQEILNRSTEIGLTSLSQGIYFLELGDKMEKFIKFKITYSCSFNICGE